MAKEITKVNKSREVLQNETFFNHAKLEIKRMSKEVKIKMSEELQKVGYDYNERIDVLVQGDVIIPYDFVLFCLLTENLKSSRGVKK